MCANTNAKYHVHLLVLPPHQPFMESDMDEGTDPLRGWFDIGRAVMVVKNAQPRLLVHLHHLFPLHTSGRRAPGHRGNSRITMGMSCVRGFLPIHAARLENTTDSSNMITI